MSAADILKAEKAAARQHLRAVLRSFPKSERTAASARICQHLRELPAFQESRVVLLFAALPSEPDLLPLLADFPGQKTFLFPLVTPTGLTLHAVHQPEELVARSGLLREPDAEKCAPMPFSAVDLALVPGLGFVANSGLRLGRGGGFYDRLLAHPDFRASTVGVCFQAQLQASLPAEAHDCRVSQVLTEAGIFRCLHQEK